jgi:hypothetical protein
MKSLAGLVVGAIGSFIGALFFLFAFNYLHSNYSEVIPNINYWEAFGVSLLLSSLYSLSNFSSLTTIDSNPLISTIGFIVVTPFITWFVLNILNDSLLTSLPDISFWTVLLISIVGVPFILINWFFSAFIISINEA